MTKLTVERTLVYRSEDGSLTRYEILRNDGSSANTIDAVLGNISLDHHGIPSGNRGIQICYGMGASRDLSSAIDECSKHWSAHYA